MLANKIIPSGNSIQCDPYWDKVTLACNFNGPSITDEAKGRTITSNAVQLDTSIKAAGASSLQFTNGNSNYASLPNSSDYDLPGDSTVELWINPAAISTSAAMGLLWNRYDNVTSSGWVLYLGQSTGKVLFQWWAGTSGNPTVGITSSAALSAGVWYHLAVSINSGTVNLYINGVLNASGSTSSVAIGANTGAPIYIGAQNTSSRFFKGNIDCLRITKGVGRYPSAFSVAPRNLPTFKCGT